MLGLHTVSKIHNAGAENSLLENPFAKCFGSSQRIASKHCLAAFLVALNMAVFSLVLPAQQQASSSRILTNAREVHNLAPELAPHFRAHLLGTVSYYDAGEHNLFIQDASGGVYVETSHPLPIAYGDLVSVDGATASSFRTDIAADPTIHLLGKGTRWPARPVTYDQLASGDEDSQLVVLRGTVRAVNLEQHENAPVVHLDVLMRGGEIEVYQPVSVIQDGGGLLFGRDGQPSLLDSEVEITGVAGGAFDTKSQLTGIIVYVQKASSIRVTKPAPVSPLSLPLTDIDTLFRYRLVQDQSERVRLRGVLTYYRPGDAAVLEENGSTVYVQTRETKPLSIGTIVDAIGFASSQEYAPSLRQAELFSTGQHGVITPREITFDEAMSGLYSDNLVAVTGLLVSQLRTATLETVTINVGGQLVTGRLARAGVLPQVRLGTRVRLTGICRILPGGPYRAPILFHIEMRDPADMQLLSTPSWFTVRHLLAVSGVVSLIAFVAASWALLLRHRVRQQTQRIERSMRIARSRSTLMEKISSGQPLSELIPQICSSANQLLPETTCIWQVAPNREGATVQSPTAPAGNSGWSTYNQVDLVGLGNVVAGRLCFNGAPSVSPAEESERAEVFTMITEVAQLAIEHCRLYEGLLHHSTHDPLTDLPNRRHCEDRLRLALGQAQASRSCVAVIYIDINRFKQVNDRFGHKIGDAYLRSIGGRLKEKLRSGDTVARIGGDEFLAIAPNLASQEEAQLLLERLQGCFEQPFSLEGQHLVGSASFGLACYPEQGENPEELKRYADHAMYLQKHGTALERSANQTDTQLSMLRRA